MIEVNLYTPLEKRMKFTLVKVKYYWAWVNQGPKGGHADTWTEDERS